MKNYFLLIAMFLSFCSYAQKCVVEKDPFTGKEVVAYDWAKKAIKFRVDENKIYLEIKFNYSGELNVIVPAETELFIKLKNSEILNLKTTKDVNPVTQVIATSTTATVVSLYTYEFLLSKDELKKLTESETELIRYPDTKGGTLDYKPRKKARLKKHLIKGSQCISENLK